MVYPSFSPFYFYECRYSELKELSTFTNSRKKLAPKQNKILHFVATHRSVSPSDLSSKQFPYSKKRLEYGNAKTYMRKLHALKLLEHDYERTSDSNNKDKGKTQIRHPYKLSKYGIYNLITNNKKLPFEIVKSLLSNYSDHILFGFFLFPYIEQETLSQVMDSFIFSQIFLYLHNCCKQLEDTIFNINHTYNQQSGYLTDPLFVWENVPTIDYDKESLRRFLIDRLRWDWVRKAEIKKTEDMTGITVSYESKFALISIDKKRKKAILSLRGRKQHEFVVRELTNDQFAVDAVLTQRPEELYLEMFLMSNMASIPTFIVSLISNYNPKYLFPTMEVLGQDERFVQALRKTKDQFDRRYRHIVEKG